MRIAVIEVPWTSDGRPGGEAGAPRALYNAGLYRFLAQRHNVEWIGDVQPTDPGLGRDPDSGILARTSFVEMIRKTDQVVARAVRAGRFPTVIGGECPVLLGCLSAARDDHAGIGCCFVDGHEDAYPPHRSPTGETAGMELGFALGMHAVPGLEDVIASMHSSEVVVLGARDAETLRAEGVPLLADRGVAVVSPDALRDGGVAQVTAACLGRLRRGGRPWWLHLGLDVLATEDFPAVRYPQPGGLRLAELRDLLATAAITPGLRGIDVTTYNSDLDPKREYAHRVVALITEFMGAVAAAR